MRFCAERFSGDGQGSNLLDPTWPNPTHQILGPTHCFKKTQSDLNVNGSEADQQQLQVLSFICRKFHKLGRIIGVGGKVKQNVKGVKGVGVWGLSPSRLITYKVVTKTDYGV